MDASVALNPAPGRTTLSKAIALGLPGEGAMLVAMLLAGCTGAPRPTRWPGPSPLPLSQHGPEPRRGGALTGARWLPAAMRAGDGVGADLWDFGNASQYPSPMLQHGS